MLHLAENVAIDKGCYANEITGGVTLNGMYL